MAKAKKAVVCVNMDRDMDYQEKVMADFLNILENIQYLVKSLTVTYFMILTWTSYYISHLSQKLK